MNNFTIPEDRKNVAGVNFKKKLEVRKAENEQDYVEKYREMKYKVIWTAVWILFPAAILLFMVSAETGWTYIHRYCVWYMQAVMTLYIGALISKD